MEKYKDKDNNQLGILLHEIKTEHEIIKKRMLNDYDKLEGLEKTFGEINKVLLNRIKGND